MKSGVYHTETEWQLSTSHWNQVVADSALLATLMTLAVQAYWGWHANGLPAHTISTKHCAVRRGLGECAEMRFHWKNGYCIVCWTREGIRFGCCWVLSRSWCYVMSSPSPPRRTHLCVCLWRSRQVICYSVMTLTCTALGTIPLATHNVRKAICSTLQWSVSSWYVWKQKWRYSDGIVT